VVITLAALPPGDGRVSGARVRRRQFGAKSGCSAARAWHAHGRRRLGGVLRARLQDDVHVRGALELRAAKRAQRRVGTATH
jgi:hypothetical protein